MNTATKTITLYMVGGAVRDELLGLSVKDYDFCAEVTGIPDLLGAYRSMNDWLTGQGFEIFVEKPEFVTTRARFPRGTSHALAGITGDFVVCRKDGPSTDGRRPDYVEVGDLRSDLERRDFTVNSMARPLGDSKTIVDLFGGKWDLENRFLRFVGDPMDRLREDGLRALRAIRFIITKDFLPVSDTRAALYDSETATLLGGCHNNRKYDELKRCFTPTNWRKTWDLLNDLPTELFDAIFTDGLWIKPTLEET